MRHPKRTHSNKPDKQNSQNKRSVIYRTKPFIITPNTKLLIHIDIDRINYDSPFLAPPLLIFSDVVIKGDARMHSEEILRRQLKEDLERLHSLILRYALGDRGVKQERDELEGAVQIKFALWRSLNAKDD